MSAVGVEQKPRVVVIGNGMVGYKFCEKFLEKNGLDKYDLTVFGEEKKPAYDRVHLTDYFTGKSLEDLTLAPVNWYTENNIQLKLGDPVIKIDKEDKLVVSKSGEIVKYDKLILATGSKPFIPPIPGVDKSGVFPYRTYDDLDRIKEYAKNCKNAVVIGGGLLGLEAAKALLDFGLDTHVLEVAPRLMPRQLDDTGSKMLKMKLEEFGVKIHTNKMISSISGNGKAEKVVFEDGSELDSSIVVVSAGIQARDELAKEAGLDVTDRGGVYVDEKLETSDPNIFAIGEVANFKNMIYGLVAPGYEMADIVSSALLGEEKKFKGADLSTKLKLIGVDVASFGEIDNFQQNIRELKMEDGFNNIYKKLYLTEDGRYLLGGILIGDTSDYNILIHKVKTSSTLPEDPSELIIGKQQSGSILDLHDSAQICACENVTKYNIVEAIEEHKITNLEELKKVTKAATGCGGCATTVSELLDAVLDKKGVLNKKVLCEHFNYTRQELFHIIKVHEIKNYTELLAKYGKGSGCEKCKPAIASMLASAWNEKLMEQQTIQDTNDRFLANIQMGGTYSIVPRIPGGEITPDKLMVIADVAKKYKLYTKVTGAQRIDLFGAKLNDLPDIWEILSNAGFESGHAYARGMRTVKSCVGSTWCHFGVQDSVSMAILVENRYKGIRFPHKVKSAVSGCIRECAEAQNKDFAIIATEKGWNLYVTGNGGTNPQHTQLLATDLDTETCIKYIDRYLMYYIKTAGHLQRTATWYNKLDGGIEFLKDVIINDSLNICDQLEKDMQSLVDNYHCEWAELVKDEEKRKRFKYFVNSEEMDSNIKFIDQRGQLIPDLDRSGQQPVVLEKY